jgi:hypothetical protein
MEKKGQRIDARELPDLADEVKKEEEVLNYFRINEELQEKLCI